MMFGGKDSDNNLNTVASGNGSTANSTQTEENDNAGLPTLERMQHDHSDSNRFETGSLSDYGETDEEDDDVENLQQAAAKETRKKLARTETQAVSCLRYVVLLVLLVTAVTVSVITFVYSRNVEHSSFEAEFESVATMVQRSFVEAVEHKMGAMDSMATGITSHALETDQTFPNVTIPHIGVKGSQVRTQTDGIFFFYLALVTDETRAGYEAYTKSMEPQLLTSYMAEEGLRQYQDQYFGISKEETAATDARAEEATEEAEGDQTRRRLVQRQQLQQILEDYDAPKEIREKVERRLHAAGPDVHPEMHEGIWGLDTYNNSYVEPIGTGPFLPMWQLSPVIPMPAVLNFNFFAYLDLAPVMQQTLNTGKAGLSYLQTNHTGSETESLIRIFMSLNQYRHDNVEYNALSDPLTQVTYPVFDTFRPLSRQITGMIITSIFWRLLFANILPDSVKGVICVVQNSLGQSVTYRIDGREATYLGPGDLHDDKYNDMVVSRDIAQYMKERAGPRSHSYTVVDLDAGYTSYSLSVYPSQDMEDTYITTDPILYAVVVACVFVFTSMVFLLYDWLVERRQAKVMDKAVKSTAVVTSLFPEAVHERLFADGGSISNNELSKELQTWKAASAEMSLARQPTIADLMRSSTRKSNDPPDLVELASPGTSRNSKGGTRPIADKFPNVTVLFADLAGFTKWSSTREPEHVFILLETLYGAFDKVALRRQVFKVETIGDCYMACTGLPNPQPDHAQRMVKFARDCMQRMDRLLVDDLVPRLGDDARDLVMRVGLHSGPVTAGVLRSDKARFQLFGDTVNTASRMESNGVIGRIHVSAATAALLPERWLTMREDKIIAKGKGEMTTYFVDAGLGARSSAGASIIFGTTDSVEMSEQTATRRESSEGDFSKRGSDGAAPGYNNIMDISSFSFTADTRPQVDDLTFNNNTNNDSSRNQVSPPPYGKPMPLLREEKTQPTGRQFGESVALSMGIMDELEV